MVLFLFQMVFMDTALTIVTGSVQSAGSTSRFASPLSFMGAITYPLFAHWAWGGGWLYKLGANFGLGAWLLLTLPDPGLCTRSAALLLSRSRMIIGPRIGKYNRDGSPNAIPGHDIVIVLTGCFILAFGWFGFNPGSTLARLGTALAHQLCCREYDAGRMLPALLVQFSTCGSGTASLMLR